MANTNFSFLAPGGIAVIFHNRINLLHEIFALLLPSNLNGLHGWRCGKDASTRHKDMKKVYLVEDNQDSADLVADVLSAFCEVKHFPEAYSALSAIQDPLQPLPEVLILDISLPGIDGVSLLRMIRSEPRTNHLAAIALTAHAMKTDESRLLSAGFNAYVSKPLVDESLLIRAVESWAGKPNPVKD